MSHGQISGQVCSDKKVLRRNFQNVIINAQPIHFGSGNINTSDTGMYSDV